MKFLVASLLFILIIRKYETANQHAPVLYPYGSEMVVTVGGNLELFCVYNNSLIWYTPAHNINDKKIKIRIEKTKFKFYEYHLSIKNISVTSVGFYGCGVNTSNNTKVLPLDPFNNKSLLKNIEHTYVFVEDSEHLIVPQNPDINIIENNSYYIPCKPASPNVEFLLEQYYPHYERINKTETKNADESTKRIGYKMPASNSKRMQFNCTAELNGKRDELKFNVTIWAKPKIKGDILSNNPYFAKQFTTLNISCDVEENFDFQRRWYFSPCTHQHCENETSIDDEVNSNLPFLVKQSCLVTCRVTNFAGTSNRSSLIIATDIDDGYVTLNGDDDEVVYIDDNKIFECKVSSFFDPFIYWIKMPENITISGGENKYKLEVKNNRLSVESILTINNLTLNDTGEYICKVKIPKNHYFKSDLIETTAVLEVLEPYLDEIDSNTNSSEFEFELGEQNIKLTCDSDGLPKPTIKWYKGLQLINETENGRIFIDNNGTTLNFKFIKMVDTGYYQCKASNRMGSKKKIFTITILAENQKSFTISMVSIAAALVLFMIIGLLLNKLRKNRNNRDELLKAGFVNFENGAIYNINPDLGIDEQAELLPYETNWEFPRDKLKLGKQLGSGAFGVVVKAVAQGIVNGEESTVVAVKMVNKSADYTLIRALVSELKIMVHIGKHPNIVNLLGACTNEPLKHELLVIVEYCEYGNLHNFLLRNRKYFVNQINSETGAIDYEIKPNQDTERITNNEALSSNYDSTVNSNSTQPQWRTNFGGDYNYKKFQRCLSTGDLLSWSYQIASGMEYLSKRKILHGDLAARNVLLAGDNIVKICDFGLAKRMYNTYNYKKKSNNPLPVKWMSIEAIRDRIFSTQSDVWAYGILLWEMFSLGCSPYPGIDANEAFFKKLLNGHRMERPQYANQKIYAIMLQCWRSGPVQRPSFAELAKTISSMLDETTKNALKTQYEKFERLNKEWIEKRGNTDYLAAMNSPEYTNLTSINPRHHYVNGPFGGSSTTHPHSPEDDEKSRYLHMRSVCVDPDSEPHYKYPKRGSADVLGQSDDEAIAMKIFNDTRIRDGLLDELKEKIDGVKETKFNSEANGLHSVGLSNIYEDMSKCSNRKTESNDESVDNDICNGCDIVGGVEEVDGLKKNESDLNHFMNPIYDYLKK